jgi:protease II
MTPDTTLARNEAASQYRIDVLDHLLHEEWCDWRTIGECGCDAGQMLISLIADERQKALLAAEREPLLAALRAVMEQVCPGGMERECGDLIHEQARAALALVDQQEGAG